MDVISLKSIDSFGTAFMPKLNAWHFEVRQGTSASAVTLMRIHIRTGLSTPIKIIGGYFTDNLGNGTNITATLVSGINTLYVKMNQPTGYIEIDAPSTISKFGEARGIYFFNQGYVSTHPSSVIDLGSIFIDPYYAGMQLFLGGQNTFKGDLGKLMSKGISSLELVTVMSDNDLYGVIKKPVFNSFTNLYLNFTTANWRGVQIYTEAFKDILIATGSIHLYKGTSIEGLWSDLPFSTIYIAVDATKIIGSFANLRSNLVSFTVESISNNFNNADISDIASTNITAFRLIMPEGSMLKYTKNKTWGANMASFYGHAFTLSDADAERLLTDLNATTWVSSGGILYIKCNSTTAIDNLITSIRSKGVTVTRYNP